MQATTHPFGFCDDRWGTATWVWPQVRRYPNGRPAVQLFCYAPDNGFIEPWATPTVNLPEEALSPTETFIKDYSENAGLSEKLVLAGIIQPEPKRFIPSGFVQIPVYEFTPQFLDFITKAQNAD